MLATQRSERLLLHVGSDPLAATAHPPLEFLTVCAAVVAARGNRQQAAVAMLVATSKNRRVSQEHQLQLN